MKKVSKSCDSKCVISDVPYRHCQNSASICHCTAKRVRCVSFLVLMLVVAAAVMVASKSIICLRGARIL
jgi:hypothetical protein